MFSTLQRLYCAKNAAQVPKHADALRIGILGAANIAPAALIGPARSHADIIVDAVAARDVNKAITYAAKHGIPRVLPNYQALVDDPSLHAIYNPLPNSLHFEWSMKAIAAGKHVLLEKPSCCNAAETRRLFEFAEERGVIVLEAIHNRFHPAVHRLREIVQMELGHLTSVEANFTMPNFFPDDDIRFNYSLGGGAMLDMGTYPLALVRFLTGQEPVAVTSATGEGHRNDPARVDLRLQATFAFPNDLTVRIRADEDVKKVLGVPRIPGLDVTIRGERGEVYMQNWIVPHMWHNITVQTSDGKRRSEQVYKPKTGIGEAWWSTYRYQLEAFVDLVKGKTPAYSTSGDDSIRHMEAIDMFYAKAVFGPRPVSQYLTQEQK